MIINVQKYISHTYNIPVDLLKGKMSIKDKKQYNLYNLSIILSWLLHPTQRYGCKSLIARLHSCNKNRVYRLYKLYNTKPAFKSFVDNAVKNYKIQNASD